jgi:hypothetical protein
MTWYKAWRKMLQGVQLVMSLVERRGIEDGFVVGISVRSSSSSTMGSVVAWCELEVCWAALMVWDAGRGCGCEVLWVQWVGCVMGGWAARLVSRWRTSRWARKLARRTVHRKASREVTSW